MAAASRACSVQSPVPFIKVTATSTLLSIVRHLKQEPRGFAKVAYDVQVEVVMIVMGEHYRERCP